MSVRTIYIVVDVYFCELVAYVKYVYVNCFFFQAEDGIRDLVRSRGLGDVYKRQGLRSPKERKADLILLKELMESEKIKPLIDRSYPPVSYTHLTLPTSDLV